MFTCGSKTTHTIILPIREAIVHMNQSIRNKKYDQRDTRFRPTVELTKSER